MQYRTLFAGENIEAGEKLEIRNGPRVYKVREEQPVYSEIPTADGRPFPSQYAVPVTNEAGKVEWQEPEKFSLADRIAAKRAELEALEAEQARREAEAKKTEGEQIAQKLVRAEQYGVSFFGEPDELIPLMAHGSTCDAVGAVRKIVARAIDSARAAAKAEQREADAKIAEGHADYWARNGQSIGTMNAAFKQQSASEVASSIRTKPNESTPE